MTIALKDEDLKMVFVH